MQPAPDNFSTCAPILILGFNRPDLLRGLIASLTKARPKKLYLAVDGPREGRIGEAQKCAECATVLDTPDWPCEVKKLVRKDNLGCRLAVTGALDWFFSQEEEGIILEDDCWPDLSFLPFATELLGRYRDNPHVGMISGNNHYGFLTDKTVSYRFSYDVSIWGWATWRRAWSLYEGDPEAFRDEAPALFRRVKLTSRSRIQAERFFQDVLATRSTWDVQWMLSLWRNEQLVAVPSCNLVANMGYGGGGGTHTGGFSYDQQRFGRAYAVSFPLVHPATVVRDIRADRLHELRSFSFLSRALTVAGLRLGAVGRAVCGAARQVERFFPALFRI